MERFEIVAIPGKGVGCRATCKIPKYECVIKEKALVSFPQSYSDDTTLIGKVNDAVSAMSSSDRKLLDSLYDPDPKGSEEYRNMRICNNNMHNYLLFPTVARVNHSCMSNVLLTFPSEEEAELRSLRDIEVGEEICMSYVPTDHLYTKAERKRALSGWHFECSCVLCSMTPQETLANDKVRILVRENMDITQKFVETIKKLNRVTEVNKNDLMGVLSISAKALELLRTVLTKESETALIFLWFDVLLLLPIARLRSVKAEPCLFDFPTKIMTDICNGLGSQFKDLQEAKKLEITKLVETMTSFRM